MNDTVRNISAPPWCKRCTAPSVSVSLLSFKFFTVRKDKNLIYLMNADRFCGVWPPTLCEPINGSSEITHSLSYRVPLTAHTKQKHIITWNTLAINNSVIVFEDHWLIRLMLSHLKDEPKTVLATQRQKLRGGGLVRHPAAIQSIVLNKAAI